MFSLLFILFLSKLGMDGAPHEISKIENKITKKVRDIHPFSGLSLDTIA